MKSQLLRADFLRALGWPRAPSRPPPAAPSCPTARTPRRPAYPRLSQPRRQLPRASPEGSRVSLRAAKLSTELVRSASSRLPALPPTPPSLPHPRHFFQELQPVCHAGCPRALGTAPGTQVKAQCTEGGRGWRVCVSCAWVCFRSKGHLFSFFPYPALGPVL